MVGGGRKGGGWREGWSGRRVEERGRVEGRMEW